MLEDKKLKDEELDQVSGGLNFSKLNSIQILEENQSLISDETEAMDSASANSQSAPQARFI